MPVKPTDFIVLIYAGLSCIIRDVTKDEAFKDARKFVSKAQEELPQLFKALDEA